MTFSNILSNLFGRGGSGNDARSYTLNVVGGSAKSIDYVNTIKGNRKILRQIYHNVNKNYALAGQLVKPIVNNNVNFIGIPELFGNKKALKVVNDVKIDYRKVHKSIEIDGTVFIWVQWNNKKQKIDLVQIPISTVNQIFIDPISKEITGYKLVEHVTYANEKNDNNQIDVTYIINKDVVARKITGSINSKNILKNPFGMLPIVRFSNDRDDDELYGHSEFEVVAPQLRFYHELTYAAGEAQSRDGHPKLKVNTSNVKQWIDNNFGAGTFNDIASGKKAISMQDRDLFINSGDDDVNYLYLNKTSGDYTSLAKKVFTNIVQGSETPEINFGANLGTSLASVREYRPVWIKKIDSKQYERTQPWLDIYTLVLNIHNFVNIKSLKMDIEMQWPTPNFASVKEQSEIVKAFSTAIDTLLKDNTLTKEEVYETLKKIGIFSINPNYKIHKEVVDEQKKESNAGVETPPNTGGDSGS